MTLSWYLPAMRAALAQMRLSADVAAEWSAWLARCEAAGIEPLPVATSALWHLRVAALAACHQGLLQAHTERRLAACDQSELRRGKFEPARPERRLRILAEARRLSDLMGDVAQFWDDSLSARAVAA